MLLIHCPWCGKRDETEFTYGGEAHIARPADGGHGMSDTEWADYVFLRTNPKGWHRERWVHAHGCGRWFNAIRHTATHEFASVYMPDEPKPPLPDRERG